MLVNGMNKWQFSLIVYFNHYITIQEIIWSFMSWSKKLLSEEKSQEGYISFPSPLPKFCMKYVQKHVKDTNTILPLNQHFLNM